MNETLTLGSSGDSVKILQEKLKILGFYNPLITGSFGLSTEEGVKAFQRDYGLEENGVVNNQMWNLLYSLTGTAVALISILPTLSYGSTGSAVAELQSKLSALLYYTGSINSNFDFETENAVKRFQMNNDLTADGVVGSQTWNRLNLLYGNLNECVTDNNNSDNVLNYTVVSGDTLYSIAKRFNTTVDAIKELNNLTSNTLSIGQILRIPAVSEESITYTVVGGDTLYSIARKYNTTVDAIKQLNNLTSNTLSIGQILIIPQTSLDYVTYTVVGGDTLYSIARKYNTTVDAIKELNNLTSNTLSIGQILKIPTTNENYFNYVVVSSDTLYSIARKYNTSVDAIKSLNNLTSNILSIGQVLRIPNK